MFKPIGSKTYDNFLFKIEDKNYTYIGNEVFTFKTTDDIEEYFSESGFNDVKYLFALGNENVYYMFYQKFITIEEFENEEMEDEYQYLYEKVSELKSDNITVENDGIVEFGNDFFKCKFIHSKQ